MYMAEAIEKRVEQTKTTRSWLSFLSKHVRCVKTSQAASESLLQLEDASLAAISFICNTNSKREGVMTGTGLKGVQTLAATQRVSCLSNIMRYHAPHITQLLLLLQLERMKAAH